ncbi:MAG: hypothetical protein HQ523_14145 [Lentisphaerae bacterium]|nr:hypothetical protein [Lentisphaerota bacterium]
MSLRVDSRFASGSVAAVRIAEHDADTTVHFAASPGGASESLWFHFRVTESAPDHPHPESITLALSFVRNLTGCDAPAALRPVYRGENQGWNRAKAGQLSIADDGQPCVSWTLPYPAPSIDVALCYPYGTTELNTLVRKSKAYWTSGVIGLSQGGRPIHRLSNSLDREPTSRPGIFMVARQHAGETPGSWVLDGILDHFSRTQENRILVWAVPMVDVGGIEHGQYGRDGFSFDLDHSWGTPPLRHETRVIQDDMNEWRSRCQPVLVLDLQATGGSASEGVVVRMPPLDEESAAARDSEKWANVFGEALSKEYAAAEFRLPPAPIHHSAGLTLGAYARETLGVGALVIEAPYALCGKTVMTPKQYREVGRRIARAALRRVLA